MTDRSGGRCLYCAFLGDLVFWGFVFESVLEGKCFSSRMNLFPYFLIILIVLGARNWIIYPFIKPTAKLSQIQSLNYGNNLLI